MGKQFMPLSLAFLMSVSMLAQGYRGVDEPVLNSKLMELPAFSEQDVVLVYNAFVVNYNTERLIPNWVAYELTEEEIDGDVPRSHGFSMDLKYKGRQAMREDYSNSGWDKGHMAPAADMKWSKEAMSESFYLTNICPQNHNLNSRDWFYLERYIRDWALKFGRVWVVCGPIVLYETYGTIGEQKVVVPDGFFKAVLCPVGKSYCSIAFVFSNDEHRQIVKDAAVSVNDVEALIGFDLFANLPDRIENMIESQCDWSVWK